MKDKKGQKLLTLEAFVKRSIVALRNTNNSDPKKNSKGIHAVFSGFNEALRSYYGWDKTQAIEAMNALADEGGVVSIPRRMGPMLYLPGEAPDGASAESQEKRASKTLGRILG